MALGATVICDDSSGTDDELGNDVLQVAMMNVNAFAEIIVRTHTESVAANGVSECGRP